MLQKIIAPKDFGSKFGLTNFCYPEIWHLVKMAPKTYIQSLVKIGSVTAEIFGGGVVLVVLVIVALVVVTGVKESQL